MRLKITSTNKVRARLHGQTLIILVGGGTKKRQSKDIEMAKSRWQDYQRRKKAQPREHV